MPDIAGGNTMNRSIVIPEKAGIQEISYYSHLLDTGLPW